MRSLQFRKNRDPSLTYLSIYQNAVSGQRYVMGGVSLYDLYRGGGLADVRTTGKSRTAKSQQSTQYDS